MTEYKFGTWYPIEELKEEFGMVLFYNKRAIFAGETVQDINGTHHYYDDNGDECLTDFIPASWMPLPPPPVEKTLEDKVDDYLAEINVVTETKRDIVFNVIKIAKQHYEGEK